MDSLPLDLVKIVITFISDPSEINTLIEACNLVPQFSQYLDWIVIFNHSFPHFDLTKLGIDTTIKDYKYYIFIYHRLRKAYRKANKRIKEFLEGYNRYILNVPKDLYINDYINNDDNRYNINYRKRENCYDLNIPVKNESYDIAQYTVDSHKNLEVWQPGPLGVNKFEYINHLDILKVLKPKPIDLWVFISYEGQFMLKVYYNYKLEHTKDITMDELVTLLTCEFFY